MGKIKLNNGTELNIIPDGIQEAGDYLTLYLAAEKTVEEYDRLFSVKENTEKISVIEELTGEVFKIHQGYTKLKECGKVYDVVVEQSEETPVTGEAVKVLLFRPLDIEKRLEVVEEKVDGMSGGSDPELQAAAMVAAQFSAQALPDALALEAKAIYPAWDGNGVKYAKDYKVLYNDVLYKCLTEHTSQADWAPDAAPSLWAKVLIPNPEVIPDWEQPLSTNPYMKGDKVRHKGKIWESLVDNNVWEPGVVGTEGQWKEVV